MISDHDDRDSANRAFNNVAIAKHHLLNGESQEEILKHLDGALSWCKPLLGVDHPMCLEAGRFSPLLLLDLKDRYLAGQDT